MLNCISLYFQQFIIFDSFDSKERKAFATNFIVRLFACAKFMTLCLLNQMLSNIDDVEPIVDSFWLIKVQKNCRKYKIHKKEKFGIENQDINGSEHHKGISTKLNGSHCRHRLTFWQFYLISFSPLPPLRLCLRLPSIFFYLQHSKFFSFLVALVLGLYSVFLVNSIYRKYVRYWLRSILDKCP